MNTRIAGGGRAGAAAQLEAAEIHSVPEAEQVSRSRLQLKPSEAALSLPPPAEVPNAVAALTGLLGTRLTVDNPAWSGDPVPGMRLLQKTLVATSLTLAEGERGELLAAIGLVEQAVQMRLRWQQMRRSAAEGPQQAESEESHAAQVET
ncbi:hypothetical protein [Duganella radicis]|uniref:Uncharacterized protein n=1 Tax=Duganella radicis TaxID=551988 RepID=A0A6L6PSB1_9BURK|nr:hypothetical protein [Duganella radicis]MTV41742.1 hypothetical protein [Duganella radicis]